MTVIALILGIIGTITGVLALIIHWRTYQRYAAKLDLDESREEHTSEPFFKWRGGAGNFLTAVNRFDAHREFVNEGGPVTELEIKTADDVRVSIVPKDHLGSERTGKVEFSKDGVTRLPDVRFEIHYLTRLKKRSKKTFVRLIDGTLEEVKE